MSEDGPLGGAAQGPGAESGGSLAVPASFQQVEFLSTKRGGAEGISPAKRPTDGPETQSAAVAGSGREFHPDVLVVEDDDDEVAIISRAIRRQGVASLFKIVRSGEDALAYLGEVAQSKDETSRSPKVILLDLKLGGIGGEEVLRQIRADEALCTIPVVILSSSMSKEDLCECYRLGANSFVSKPAGTDHPGDHVLEIARYWLELNRPATAR